MVKTWSDDNPKAALMSRKRTMIVDAALRAFLENGYAESSVNRIAEEAGVSIKTLYRHFESKDDLFSAVMHAACSTPDTQSISTTGVKEADEPDWFHAPPTVALPLAGGEYLRHALSEEQLALYRVVTRDAPRFPELARRYREQVTGTRDALFASYLERWLPVVGWQVADKYGAAAVFAALLKAALFDDVLFGVKGVSEEEIASCASNAATQMLALMEGGRL
ncbi:AcrR family transcriptional regulator [Paraburkholderia sp. EB58]|jgi:AcrR family transcriptional regulator|uniref:TetR/AcrR family transcriptional regulator n=1 Tax=Paraburkholderia sp. EB58 TaxID=3035125 RepID=UPI003D24CC4C